MTAGTLAARFIQARALEGHDWPGDAAALETLLAGHLEAGRAAWADVDVDAGDYVAHVARHLAGAGEDQLRDLRGVELYLACACAAGDATAMALFERRYFGEIDAAAARMRCPPALCDDVKQMLRRILFVAEGARPAAASTYAGRGDLGGWVRVSATRELRRLLIKEKRSVPLEEDRFLDAVAPGDDPELGYLRARYQDELKQALSVALAELPERDRALLRLHVLGGLNIDKIGALYGVHRATIARWLVRAHEGICERTRTELARRFGIGATEADSIIRLVQSRLDLSLERLLAE